MLPNGFSSHQQRMKRPQCPTSSSPPNGVNPPFSLYLKNLKRQPLKGVVFSLYFSSSRENKYIDLKMETIRSCTTSNQVGQPQLDTCAPRETCCSPGCPFSSHSSGSLRVSLSSHPLTVAVSTYCVQGVPWAPHNPHGPALHPGCLVRSDLNKRHPGAAGTALHKYHLMTQSLKCACPPIRGLVSQARQRRGEGGHPPLGFL